MFEILNKVLWGVASIVIIFSGLYFSKELFFPQINIKALLHSVKRDTKKESISPISTLMMVLAGRIGVGSLAGVALAIYYGGAGAIFWMWIITLICAIHTFYETILGNVYKERDFGDVYKGGPMYYIKNGLHKPKIGMIYAVLILLAYVGGFIGIQANTITKSIQVIFPIMPVIVGIILVIATAIIIFGGVTRISNMTNKLVPLMTLFYVGVSGYILIKSGSKIPNVLKLIITDAFNVTSFISGFLPMLIIGIQRGIFAMEAGLGTGSIASSITANDDSVSLGYLQIIGIYITIFLICTATAFIILTSNYLNFDFSNMNGIELTQHAFTYHLGNFGNYFVFINILLFSFSTILTGYYYGESSLKYLNKKVTSKKLFILKIVNLSVILLGSLMSPGVLWKIVDILVAFLALINIYALFSLKDVVKEEVMQNKLYKLKRNR